MGGQMALAASPTLGRRSPHALGTPPWPSPSRGRGENSHRAAFSCSPRDGELSLQLAVDRWRQSSHGRAGQFLAGPAMR